MKVGWGKHHNGNFITSPRGLRFGILRQELSMHQIRELEQFFVRGEYQV